MVAVNPLTPNKTNASSSSSIPGVEEVGGTLMTSDGCVIWFKYILFQEEHGMLMSYLKKSLLSKWTSFNLAAVCDNIFHHKNKLNKLIT